MNKKIFASALFAVAALVSTSASAAITYGNSTGVGANVQGGNAVAAAGGASVRANDITLFTTADGDIGAKSSTKSGEVVLRLPKGLNFDGSPVYTVTPVSGTASVGLTLKDSAGDPTLTDAQVTMSDANGDGGTTTGDGSG